MKILQIFNRYLEYGGEEGSVARIAVALREKVELHTFYGSTAETLKGPLGRWRIPLLMQKNPQVLRQLRALQESRGFGFWQIHNVFPTLSVATYELAAEMGVPVIQYLHNYRLGCLNATYYRDDHPCRECRPGHSLPGVVHGCWRGSRLASASMATALHRLWSKGSVDRIKAFIALSEAQKSAHVAMGIPPEKITVIPHYMEADANPPNPAPTDGDVLYLGRLTEEKGVQLLLKSWAEVDSHGRTLRIVGDGAYLPELRRLAAELRLQNVIFHGFVPKEQHQDLWSRCAFFVAPSLWMEPFGMVILEAWKQARPVLATNLGSFPELIKHGENGWLAEPNARDFSRALQSALDCGSGIPDLGANGRRRLEENFSRQQWSDRVFDFYQNQALTTNAGDT